MSGDGDGDGAGEGIGDGSGGQDAGTGDTGEGTGGFSFEPDDIDLNSKDESNVFGLPSQEETNEAIAGFLGNASGFGVMGMIGTALGAALGPGLDEGSTDAAASEGEGSPGVGGAGGSGEGTTLLTQPDPAVVTPLPEVVDTPGEVVPDLDKGTSAASDASPTVTPNTPTPAPGSLIRRRRRSSTILTTPQGVGQLGGDGSALRGSRRTRSLPVGVPRQTLLGG